MPTQKQRKYIKRVLKNIHKEQAEEETNFCAPPPWVKAQTKQQAWNLGHNYGYIEARSKYNQDAEVKKKNELQQEASVRLDALRIICNTGQTLMEAMTKALLSYDKNL